MPSETRSSLAPRDRQSEGGTVGGPGRRVRRSGAGLNRCDWCHGVGAGSRVARVMRLTARENLPTRCGPNRTCRRTARLVAHRLEC